MPRDRFKEPSRVARTRKVPTIFVKQLSRGISLRIQKLRNLFGV
ncbi:MAG: hypothetical protein JWP89_100 [Schlesneria sp.]|nr:hypothetical protein [Schlesneria sp.]